MKWMLMVGLMGCSTMALAQQQNQSVSLSIPVSAEVQASCVIVGSENIPYGLYNPVTLSGAPEVLTQSHLQVRCTAGTRSVKVLLSQGEHFATSSTCINPVRRLKSEKGDFIHYEIFHDEDRQNHWGCAESNSHVIDQFQSSIIPVHLDTYSRIPAGQNIAEGVYTDIVDVSVLF